MNISISAPQHKANLLTKEQSNCCHNHCCCCNNKMEGDMFKRQGIIPPKDWNPDPIDYLEPKEKLSPAEKLKKKWQDLMKPKYTMIESVTTTTKGISGVKDGTVQSVSVITSDNDNFEDCTQEEKPSLFKRVKIRICNFFNRIFHK